MKNHRMHMSRIEIAQADSAAAYASRWAAPRCWSSILVAPSGGLEAARRSPRETALPLF